MRIGLHQLQQDFDPKMILWQSWTSTMRRTWWSPTPPLCLMLTNGRRYRHRNHHCDHKSHVFTGNPRTEGHWPPDNGFLHGRLVRWQWRIKDGGDDEWQWRPCLEYLIRFACSPKKWTFLKVQLSTYRTIQVHIRPQTENVKAPLNIIDLLAILPYFLAFLLEGFKVCLNSYLRDSSLR